MTLNDHLRELPPLSEYKNLVDGLIADGKLAEIQNTILTPKQIAEGEVSSLEWVGSLDSIAFVGYPYLSKTEVRSDEGKLISRTPVLLDLGFNLIPLFWDNDKQCFACVRGDVYVQA